MNHNPKFLLQIAALFSGFFALLALSSFLNAGHPGQEEQHYRNLETDSSTQISNLLDRARLSDATTAIQYFARKIQFEQEQQTTYRILANAYMNERFATQNRSLFAALTFALLALTPLLFSRRYQAVTTQDNTPGNSATTYPKDT